MKIKLIKPVKGRYFTFITLLPGSVLEVEDKAAQKMIDEGKAEGESAKPQKPEAPKDKKE